MKKWSPQKRWLIGFCTCLAVIVCAYLVLIFLNPFHAHEHCSKGLGLDLRQYAADHAGQYPQHTNGFGDALLLLVKEGISFNVSPITAPGDDGRMYKECLERDLDVPEEKCSRIYIQGLAEANAFDCVVMAFDAYPTRGGDHFRAPWGKPMRDVVFSDGSVQFIHEKQWPTFAREQMERLVSLGFNRDEMERLFGIKSQ